jgi:quercetin dioxygenase-like cupin family protein
MHTGFVYLEDLNRNAEVPENGILSRTLHNDERIKIIQFSFAAGQELSAHTAPCPATLCFLSGEAQLQLGEEERLARAGTFVYMAPNLTHGIKARSPVVLLLTLVKSPPTVG